MTRRGYQKWRRPPELEGLLTAPCRVRKFVTDQSDAHYVARTAGSVQPGVALSDRERLDACEYQTPNL